ncbi:MAG: LuxR C-terminal-related transcriptional regulator [Gammaproteobacteria bacterium]|nr:LuxR C-terminal-related transcriptional regulator [Gammaproteobacteria bacterium]
MPPHILDETPTPAGEASDARAALDQLSARQQTVLGKAIKGKINKVIADELNIAEGTVKAHLSAAYRALGANNRSEALYIVTKNEIKLPEST